MEKLDAHNYPVEIGNNNNNHSTEIIPFVSRWNFTE